MINSWNVEKFEKCRKTREISNNSINVKKFEKYKKNSNYLGEYQLYVTTSNAICSKRHGQKRNCILSNCWVRISNPTKSTLVHPSKIAILDLFRCFSMRQNTINRLYKRKSNLKLLYRLRVSNIWANLICQDFRWRWKIFSQLILRWVYFTQTIIF